MGTVGLASPPLAILLVLTLSNSVRPHEIYWFAVAHAINGDRPARSLLARIADPFLCMNGFLIIGSQKCKRHDEPLDVWR